MKTKYFIYLVAIIAIGLTSCKDNSIKENSATSVISEKKSVTTEEKEVVPKVKNEVQVGDEKLVYRVSLGVLPDLTYKGVGMRAAKVHKDRPGYIGGMQAGDIVKKINGEDIKDLVEYTKLLGIYKKGDSVELTIDRNGQTIKAKIVFD